MTSTDQRVFRLEQLRTPNVESAEGRRRQGVHQRDAAGQRVFTQQFRGLSKVLLRLC
jgi:hypothetical protein